MNNIFKSFVNVNIAFKNVMQHFAQKNTNFVIFVIVGIFALIYKIILSTDKVVWILAILNALLCLINYAKNKNLTEATMTLIIGLFTIFTVEWNNEFIIIFTVSILFYIILSFIVSSIQLAGNIESIISVAAGYWQYNGDHKTKYKILHDCASKPTKHQQLSIEERSLIVKELIFENIGLDRIDEAKEIIEGFKTVLGFTISEALPKYKLLSDIFNVQKQRSFRMNDMELFFNYVLDASCNPSEYFEIIENLKYYVLVQKKDWFIFLTTIAELVNSYRDKEIVILKYKEKIA